MNRSKSSESYLAAQEDKADEARLDKLAEPHATVMRDGFKVPLIGIPQSAVMQECDLCHDEFPMSEIELVNSQALCKKCKLNSN